MANEKLSAMTQIPALSDTDIFYTVDATNAFYKCTGAQLKDYIGSPGIDFFDFEVDGVGGQPGVYAKLSDISALSDGDYVIKVSASYAETDLIDIGAGKWDVFISAGVNVDLGVNRFDVTSGGRIQIYGYNRFDSTVTYTPVANGLDMIVGINPVQLCSVNNLKIDFSSSTATSFSVGTTVGCTIKGCTILSGNSDSSGVILNNVNSSVSNTTIGNTGNSKNSIIITVGRLFQCVFIDNSIIGGTKISVGSDCIFNNLNIFGTSSRCIIESASSLQGIYADSIPISIVANASDILFDDLVIGSTGTLDANGQSSLVFSNIPLLASITSTSVNSNCKIVNASFTTLNTFDGVGWKINCCSFSGGFTTAATANATTILGCFATSFTDNGTGTIRAGNNSVIGNDYLTEETAYFGPYTAIVGSGEDYTEVSAALSAGKKGILVVSNTTETATCSITGDTYILLLGVTVDMGNFNFDQTTSNTSLLSVTGIGSTKSKLLFSPTSANYKWLDGDDTGAETIFNNLTIETVTTEDSSNAINNLSLTRFDNCYINLPNALFGFSMKTDDSYINDCVFVGGGSNCQLVSSPSFVASTEFSNVEIRGEFQLVAQAIKLLSNSGGTYYNNINFNTTTVLADLAHLEISDASISNVYSPSYTYTVNISSSFNIANCPHISSADVQVGAAGAIINCVASTFNNMAGNSIRLIGNNSVIGNSYLPIATASNIGFTGSAETGAWNTNYFCDTSGGNIVINLPTAVGNVSNHIIVKKITSDVNIVTINAFSGEAIDSAASVTLSSHNQVVDITSNSATAFIV